MRDLIESETDFGRPPPAGLAPGGGAGPDGPAADLSGVEVVGVMRPGDEEVLTPSALAFVAELQRRFGAARAELLARREATQARLDAGEMPDFLPDTAEVREGDWRVAPLPADLLDRRVEITGPVDRKMIINALNSGAQVFMADFEDSSTPAWRVMVDGQRNLRDAVARTITFEDPVKGKSYRLGSDPAVLMVRPRGWHLEERHMLVDGAPVAASLFDFGLYLFHNAKALVAQGTGPYFYLPKLEHYLEARLWNDVFVAAQGLLGLPRGTIRATVLVEHLLLSFQLHEVLFELRQHAAGLNCGRWDYIFSAIKVRRNHPEAVTPDRAQVTMTAPCMRAYTQLVVQTCHRRGASAIGGMAAQIPIKGDEEANAVALAKVEADKRREVEDGHDGTWVAHPGLVAPARALFEEGAPEGNQHHVLREDVKVGVADLLAVPEGTRTEAGVRVNVEVGVRYLAAWLGGTGCVPLHHLMEDAATAEICRAQLWQWVRHGAKLADGRVVTAGLVQEVLVEEVAAIRARGEAPGTLDAAAELFEALVLAEACAPFLTSAAYPRIVEV